MSYFRGSYEIVIHGPQGDASIQNSSRPLTLHKLVVRLLKAAVPFVIVHRFQVLDRKDEVVEERVRYVPMEAWSALCVWLKQKESESKAEKKAR